MAISAKSKILASDVSGAIKSITRSGTTFTYTCLDGSTGTFTQQDNNTTYSAFTKATSSAAGKAGLVPAPAAGAQSKFLRGDATWQTISTSSYTGTVSQKHNSTFVVSDSGVTKTISGLTAMKPVIICWKPTENGTHLLVTSGTDVLATNTLYNGYVNTAVSNKPMWAIVIPTGTSISLYLTTGEGKNTQTTLIVYQ